MEHLPQLIQDFISVEKTKALDNNILFILEDTPRVRYSERLCNGFFEPELKIENNKKIKVLATAIGKPLEEWLPIFVHESSHMDQFLENSQYWIPSSECDLIDEWLSGKKVPKNDIENLIKKIIMVEADCEIRSLKKIQEFNLPIKNEDYCRNANSYLLFHHWMADNKEWYTTAPYEIPEIFSKMPSTLGSVESYLQRPEQSIIDLFEQCKAPKKSITPTKLKM